MTMIASVLIDIAVLALCGVGITCFAAISVGQLKDVFNHKTA